MDSDKILQTTRDALGLEPTGTDFNAELLIHINSALSTLRQNGIGTSGVVVDTDTTWGDFKNAEQTNGNTEFELVPAFVFLKTKLLFDPPPPSNASFFATAVDEKLWRLRLAYELDNPLTTTTTISEEDLW